MGRAYFNAYHSTLRAIEPLDDAERGRLFTALLEYSASGEERELPGNERFLFPALREQIDRDRARYEEKCETNRRNGALGGAKRKANAPQTPPKEKEKEKEKENVSPPGGKAVAFYRENFGQGGRYLEQKIDERAAEVGEEQVIAALREAARSGAKSPWRYAEAVIARAGRQGERSYGGAARQDLIADFPDRTPTFSVRKRGKPPP